jgi:hypothetical protein
VTERLGETVRHVVGVALLVATVFGGQTHASTLDLALEESACIADPSDPGSWRILLRFEIPDVLGGAAVDLAVLRVEVPTDSQEAREVSVEIFPVTCVWSAEGVVWGEEWQSGEGVWDAHRGSIGSVIGSEQGELRADVTAIVGRWLRDDAEAHGLVLAPSAGGPPPALTGPPPEVSLRVWYTGAQRSGPSPVGD